VVTHASLIFFQTGGGSPAWLWVFQIVAIIAIFYFLLIRPQKKERERHEEMIRSITKGDEIITAGGVVGKVVHATENRLTIKSAENTRLVIQRGRVAQRIDPEATAEE